MIGEMNSKPIIKEGLYYGMVTYGINEQRELKTLNLLIPNSDITTYLENVNIKDLAEKFSTVRQEEENHKKIVSLKEDILKKKNYL